MLGPFPLFNSLLHIKLSHLRIGRIGKEVEPRERETVWRKSPTALSQAPSRFIDCVLEGVTCWWMERKESE